MARRAIDADGGELTVRDSPGVGCVFTISLPFTSCRSGAARVGVDSEAFRYGGAKAKSNDRIRSACATGLARNA
jgi:hypothetical protein